MKNFKYRRAGWLYALWKRRFCGCFRFYDIRQQEFFSPCKTSEKEKSSVSFLKSQIFYSIRAANDIFPDSHVFLRFFGCVLLLLLLLLLVVLPLISSFLFQTRIIPFFHFEGTKDKQSYVASHHPPHRPTIGSSLLFLEMMITSNAEISRRAEKKL